MTKEVYSVKDIQELLGGVSYNFACRKIREIKTVSDRLEIRGHVHRLDWEAYLNRFKKDSAATLSARVVEQETNSIV